MSEPIEALSGMVERLPGSGVTEEALAFARAYLADGPMDPVVVAMMQDPDRIAARQTAIVRQRESDWAGLGHYRDANVEAAARQVNAVFIGDSITEMWGVAHPELFEGDIVNRGVSGQTSPQMLLRFLPDVIALKPRVVHLMCGVNDIAGNTGPTTPQDYRNNVLAMVDLAQVHGLSVILASLTPVSMFNWAPLITNCVQRVAELNAWIEELARARGLVHVDYFAALATADGALASDYTRDGVHPTRRGYDAMKPRMEAALALALET